MKCFAVLFAGLALIGASYGTGRAQNAKKCDSLAGAVRWLTAERRQDSATLENYLGTITDLTRRLNETRGTLEEHQFATAGLWIQYSKVDRRRRLYLGTTGTAAGVAVGLALVLLLRRD